MKKSIITLAVLAVMASAAAQANSGDNGNGKDNGKDPVKGCNCNYVTVPVYNAGQAAQDKAIAGNAAAIEAEKNRAWTEEQKQWNEIQTKYTESAGKALEGQVANNKADQAVRDAGQDKAIAAADTKATNANAAAQTAGGLASNAAQLATKVDTNLKDHIGQQAVRDAGQDKAILAADTKATNANAAAQTAGGLAANAGQLANKVNTDLKDHIGQQAGRDAGQDEHINAVQGAAQTANDRASVLEGRQDVTEQGVRDVQVSAETANNRASALETRSDATEAKVAGNASEITTLGRSVAQKVDNGVFQQRAADLQTRIDENRADQQKVNKAMSATLNNHEGRINSLEQQTNSRFADIDKRVEDNRKKANAGTSTALAAAGIPQVLDSQTFALGAATGGYEGEQALAVGFSARVTQNVVIKAAVATDSQHGVGYNAGVAVGW